jgi:hypothetical protein
MKKKICRRTEVKIRMEINRICRRKREAPIEMVMNRMCQKKRCRHKSESEQNVENK